MFAWIVNMFYTKTARQKIAEKAAAEEKEKIRIALPPRYNMLSESSRVQHSEPAAVRRDDRSDLLNPMNPFSPISPFSIWNSSPSSAPEPSRDCSAPSYEPDTSSRHDHCSSLSYDSGSSSSSYDSSSSSSYDSCSSSSSSFD